jgi:hypothetical protein
LVRLVLHSAEQRFREWIVVVSMEDQRLGSAYAEERQARQRIWA